MMKKVQNKFLKVSTGYFEQKNLFLLWKTRIIVCCSIYLYYKIRQPTLTGLEYLFFEKVSAFSSVKKLRHNI